MTEQPGASNEKTDWMLRAETGPLAGKLFPLPAKTIIGRALSCGISIPEDGLSREHAELVIEDNVLTIRDLGSSNGTFLNGTQGSEIKPQHGDTVSFDQMRFRVVGPSNDMDKTIISMAPAKIAAATAPSDGAATPAATAASGDLAPPPQLAAARANAKQKSGIPAWIVLVGLGLLIVVAILALL